MLEITNYELRIVDRKEENWRKYIDIDLQLRHDPDHKIGPGLGDDISMVRVNYLGLL